MFEQKIEDILKPCLHCYICLTTSNSFSLQPQNIINFYNFYCKSKLGLNKSNYIVVFPLFNTYTATLFGHSPGAALCCLLPMHMQVQPTIIQA